MKSKHIGFCKIGKSIKFASPYSPIGGDNEAPQLIISLANNNPDITFHIIGRSDFAKLSEPQRVKLFKYDNVVNAFEGKTGKADPDDINNYLKNNGIKLDAAIMMIGQIGTVTIPNRIRKIKDPENGYASIIDMTANYTTPITNWWNDNQDIPVIEIINDPRYTLKVSRDIIGFPKASLSQHTYSYVKNSIKSYEDQTRVPTDVPVKYAEMEKIFLTGKTVEPINVEKRTVPFMIVLNEGTPSRYNMLNEWVLSGVEDVEIYGKWEHENTLSDTRFKGAIKLDEVQEKLKSVRSSFIIPIAPGWSTSKYVELIYAGVVPILHPSYDSQQNTGIYKLLRPKTVKELNELVVKLQDDEFYLKTINELREQFCSEEYLNGKKLSEIIFKEIYDDYELPNTKQYTESKVCDLSNFF